MLPGKPNGFLAEIDPVNQLRTRIGQHASSVAGATRDIRHAPAFREGRGESIAGSVFVFNPLWELAGYESFAGSMHTSVSLS